MTRTFQDEEIYRLPCTHFVLLCTCISEMEVVSVIN